jgi:hypothetical protein
MTPFQATCVVMALAFFPSATPAAELSPEAAEEVVARGEVIFTNEGGGMVVRHRGEVYFCGVTVRERNSMTPVPHARVRCFDTEQ